MENIRILDKNQVLGGSFDIGRIFILSELGDLNQYLPSITFQFDFEGCDSFGTLSIDQT